MRGSRGGTGGPDPSPEKFQSYRIRPDPLENYKATKPASNVGPLSAHQLYGV